MTDETDIWPPPPTQQQVPAALAPRSRLGVISICLSVAGGMGLIIVQLLGYLEMPFDFLQYISSKRTHIGIPVCEAILVIAFVLGLCGWRSRAGKISLFLITLAGGVALFYSFYYGAGVELPSF